jgi:hypothetical protein
MEEMSTIRQQPEHVSFPVIHQADGAARSCRRTLFHLRVEELRIAAESCFIDTFFNRCRIPVRRAVVGEAEAGAVENGEKEYYKKNANTEEDSIGQSSTDTIPTATCNLVTAVHHS